MNVYFGHYIWDMITKNAHICEEKIVLTIFAKKSFFFRANLFFEGIFFGEITKKSEK